MEITFIAFLVLIIGGIIGFFVRKAIDKSKLENLVFLNNEFEQKIFDFEKDFNDLKNKFDSAKQKATIAETKLESQDDTLAEQKRKIITQQERIENLAGERKELATRLETNEKIIKEQKETLNKAKEELLDSFKALSTDVLKSNSEEFMKIASKNLENIIEKSKTEFGRQAIEETLKPLKESLNRYDHEIGEMEKSRQKAYGSLLKELEHIHQNNLDLKNETNALVNALKRPEVRGRWGEISLRRVVELVGMNEFCDFEEQISVDSEDGRLRPDMIVHLPGKIDIVVDSKAPLKHYLKANEAEDRQERQKFLKKHKDAVTDHMRKLARKDYWSQFERSPDFVVMFLPGESFFSAALEMDKDLLEEGFKKRVILATPATLISLMRTVAMSWQQHRLSENAREIARKGEELYHRFVRFTDLYGNVGKKLDQTVKAFNASVGSYTARLLPGAQKLCDLGSYQIQKEPDDIEPLERTPRELE